MNILPTLHSRRLLLRQRSVQDLPGLISMGMDPEVMRFIGDGTLPDPEEHREVLMSRIERDFGNGLGYWSVFPADHPYEFLGWVYLIPFPRGTDLQVDTVSAPATGAKDTPQRRQEGWCSTPLKTSTSAKFSQSSILKMSLPERS